MEMFMLQDIMMLDSWELVKPLIQKKLSYLKN